MSDEGILNKTPKTKHSKQTVTLFDIYEIQVITQSFSKAKVRDMELSHSWLTRLPRGALAPIYLSHLWGGSSDGSALDLY